MALLALPPSMDSTPKFCFCGRKAVESHEFLFCSIECARQDALQSLDDPNCHYRNAVRHAYVQAGAPGLRPRRMASAVHLRPARSQRHPFAIASPPPQQNNAALASVAPWTTFEKVAPLPALPGNCPTRMAAAGEFATGRHHPSRRDDFANVPSRSHPIVGSGGHTFEQISLDAIPLPEHVPLHPLRRVPTSIDGHDTKKSSVAALLNFSRFRKGKEIESTERVFGHPVNTDIAATRNGSRKGRIF